MEANKGKTEEEQESKIPRNPEDWASNHSAYESDILEIYCPLRGEALGSVKAKYAMTDTTNRYKKLKEKLS